MKLTVNVLYLHVRFPSIKFNPGITYFLQGLAVVSHKPSKPFTSKSGASFSLLSHAGPKYLSVQLHIPKLNE